MDIQVLITAIGSVGFPIVAFFVSAYALKYAFDYSMHQQEKAFDEIANLTEAVNNNTKVLTLLVKRMGDDNNEN